MKSRLAAGLLLVLWGMSSADSLVLGAVAPAGPTQKTRMPTKYLKVSASSPSTVLLVWRLGVRPDMQWVATERYNILLKQWNHLDVVYVANEAIRYEHGGLQGSTQYRFQVCGYVKEPSGKVSRPCTEPTTVRTPVALDSRGAITIQPRVPPVFVISAVTPAATGFHLCTGLTGLVGRYSGGTIKPSDLSSSICAPGNVTITQTNPKVNMIGQKIRLFSTHEAYDGFDYRSAISGHPRTDVYELGFANNNSVTFQVAFASGRGIQRWPEETGYVTAHFGTDSWPLGFTAEYQGTGYANSSCSYKASPVAVSCK
ncbi:MAG: hypothetical protein HW419_157 [Deltaproteobacteria bacterium]|nr:hypothetical protein [Deltaproteobacteria bacterium]